MSMLLINIFIRSPIHDILLNIILQLLILLYYISEAISPQCGCMIQNCLLQEHIYYKLLQWESFVRGVFLIQDTYRMETTGLITHSTSLREVTNK